MVVAPRLPVRNRAVVFHGAREGKMQLLQRRGVVRAGSVVVVRRTSATIAVGDPIIESAGAFANAGQRNGVPYFEPSLGNVSKRYQAYSWCTRRWKEQYLAWKPRT